MTSVIALDSSVLSCLERWFVFMSSMPKSLLWQVSGKNLHLCSSENECCAFKKHGIPPYYISVQVNYRIGLLRVSFLWIRISFIIPGMRICALLSCKTFWAVCGCINFPRRRSYQSCLSSRNHKWTHWDCSGRWSAEGEALLALW